MGSEMCIRDRHSALLSSLVFIEVSNEVPIEVLIELSIEISMLIFTG